MLIIDEGVQLMYRPWAIVQKFRLQGLVACSWLRLSVIAPQRPIFGSSRTRNRNSIYSVVELLASVFNSNVILGSALSFLSFVFPNQWNRDKPVGRLLRNNCTMGGQGQVDHATLTSSIDSLRILIGEHRVLGNDYRTSLTSILADLHESVEKLGDDFRHNTELPDQIITEAVSLLNTSEHSLASIRQHVNSQTSTKVLNNDADASLLKTVSKRLKIASDMHTLYEIS